MTEIKPTNRPVVMAISAHDPSGACGIQADIEAIASCGCHSLSVISAITARDTQGVKDQQVTESTIIIEQTRALLEDIPVSAIKIGNLASIENVEAIYTILQDYRHIPIVIDPLLHEETRALHANNMVDALLELIIPLATLIAPDTTEVALLAREGDCFAAQAQELIESGCEHVLITGARESTGDVINNLYNSQGLMSSYEWQRLEDNYRGAGSTLSSSIAGYLAHGSSVGTAVERAQHFTWNALKAAEQQGMGRLTPNRFYWTQQSLK